MVVTEMERQLVATATSAHITGDGDGGIVVDPGMTGGDGDEGPRETECTVDPVTGEQVCVCIKLATWGALGTYGAVPGADGQDAIVCLAESEQYRRG